MLSSRQLSIPPVQLFPQVNVVYKVTPNSLDFPSPSQLDSSSLLIVNAAILCLPLSSFSPLAFNSLKRWLFWEPRELNWFYFSFQLLCVCFFLYLFFLAEFSFHINFCTKENSVFHQLFCQRTDKHFRNKCYFYVSFSLRSNCFSFSNANSYSNKHFVKSNLIKGALHYRPAQHFTAGNNSLSRISCIQVDIIWLRL